MDIIMTLFSTAHYSHAPPPVSTPFLAGKHHPTTTTATPTSSFLLSANSSQDSPNNPYTSLRLPTTQKPLKTSISQTSQEPKNPLKNFIHSKSAPTTPPSDTLRNKLWLSSKLSPPPPPPLLPPLLKETIESGNGDEISENSDRKEDEKGMEFREKCKIFVGNLPLWIKKNEVAEFFRQFGPIKNVILIKGHDDWERNMGFGFVIYSGPTAEKAAMKAVEFDGVEFHGRLLTVKLDDGRRMKAKTEGRARWVEGKEGNGDEYRSKRHEERGGSRREFRMVLETHPENWQAVVRMFERIKKPSRKEFGLLVNYYARRGDMHRARETFEKMRARGIEPNLHVFTNLIHAYAVGRDMEEALSCVRKMEEEGIEMSLVTYSILVGGFAKIGNIDQGFNMDRAEALVREMEEEGIDAPIDIYHTMMDGYTMK